MSWAHRELGVDEGASWEETHAAYRRLAQIFHPDRFAEMRPDVRSEAEDRMRRVNLAYQELRRDQGPGRAPDATPPGAPAGDAPPRTKVPWPPPSPEAASGPAQGAGGGGRRWLLGGGALLVVLGAVFALTRAIGGSKPTPGPAASSTAAPSGSVPAGPLPSDPGPATPTTAASPPVAGRDSAGHALPPTLTVAVQGVRAAALGRDVDRLGQLGAARDGFAFTGAPTNKVLDWFRNGRAMGAGEDPLVKLARMLETRPHAQPEPDRVTYLYSTGRWHASFTADGTWNSYYQDT